MQSLYNVIKATSIVSRGKKQITTEYTPKTICEEIYEETSSKEIDVDYTEEIAMDCSENLSEAILNEAKIKRDEIVSEAYKQAEKIQKDAYSKAYELGYAEGKEKGYSDGYEESYEKNIKKVQEERASLIKEAQNTSSKIIESAKLEYLRYLDEKKDEIVVTVKNIVQAVFKREIKDEDSLNFMVLDVLNLSKNAKTLILRCNEKYQEELKKTIDIWKTREVFKGEIFIILDETISEGNIMIEKGNGKILISIDKALQKIEEILFSE